MQARVFSVDVEHQLLQTELFLFAITDKELNVLTCNRLFQSTFGIIANDYFKAKDVFVQAVHTQPAAQNNQMIINDEHLNPVTQQTRQFRWEFTGIRNENAEITGFSFLGNYRMPEKEKETTENRIRLALDKTGDNAWEYNFKTNTAWFSAANNHFLGYSSEELNERENHDKWWQNTHPDDKFLLIKNDQEYRAGKRESHSLEYRIFHKDGTMKWVLDRGVVIERDETAMPVRIVGTHTDITNEKKMHLELMTQKDQKRKDTVEAVLQAQENERDHIANELHEGVAQVLASVKMILDRAANNPSGAGDELHIASEKITGVVNELKSISQNINTSSLKMLGLSQTISDYVESVSGMSDVHFHLDLSDFDYEIEIDYPVQLALLRIIQEKVKNIIRHSGAANGYVQIAVHNGMVHLCMKDDGVGFDTDNNKLGLGFKNIYSRAEQYNGKVSITSSKGNGCQLEVKLPVSVNRRADKQSAA